MGVISGNVPDITTWAVERYNLFTDTWHSMPSLPQRLRYASGAVLHNQLYVIGDWSEGPPMIVRRAQFKLLVCNGDLFAVGGDDATTHKTTIEKFDRRTQRWSIVTEFKEQRLMHSSTVAGSRIYIFGGMVSSTQALDTWDAFDVRSNRWDSDLNEGSSTCGDDDFDDISGEDDYCGVGYDDDNDFDIDFEMTSTPSTHTGPTSVTSASPLPPIHSGSSSRVTSPIFVSISGGSSVMDRNSFAPSPIRNDGMHIQVSVPGSALKRSHSGTFSGSLSNVATPVRSSSYQTMATSQSLGNLSTPTRAASDGILLGCNGSTASLTTPYSSGRPSKRARKCRRRRRSILKIERKLPFTHAFGCAITIPAISLYF